MKKSLAVIIICLLFLSGCSMEDTSIMHGDLLNIGDITYVCSNISVPDKRVIGKTISKVRNRVIGRNNVSGYILKDGDSLNLKKGTPVYEVKGIDAEHMVSVKWKNGQYLIYINMGKSDEILMDLREDIDNAVGVRVKSILPEGRISIKDIYDFEIIDSLKNELAYAKEYTDEYDNLTRVYSFEFLIPYNDAMFKPCMSLVYKTGEEYEYGILYDNGIKLAGPVMENIIKESY